MLHLYILLGSLGVALLLRSGWAQWHDSSASWQQRWQQTRLAFALPPLLLITTAMALLWMGPICHMGHHQMIHGWPGSVTYGWAIAFLLIVLFWSGKLLLDARRSWCQLQQYKTIQLASAHLPKATARQLPTSLPFIAQMGLWQPQLVVSQGVLEQLDAPHFDAVLQHEAAHLYYADTLWFGVLGILRRCTQWLPHSDVLWQELLLLRELRADRWAADRVDPLLLAEALYLLVSVPHAMPDEMTCGAAFDEVLVRDRLTERVDALLAANAQTAVTTAPVATWLWRFGLVSVAGLPLTTLLLHS